MRLNVVLLIALLAAVAANLTIRWNPARPNLEYLPEMVHSIAYDTYAPNPNYPDGKTLQPPVAGTIPHPMPSRDRQGAVDPERGAKVYQTFCLPCHGPAGKGDGLVAQRGFPPPPSLLAGRAVNLTGDEIFQILTAGQKNMPSYASQVSAEDRRSVILFVRSLQRAAAPIPQQAGQP